MVVSTLPDVIDQHVAVNELRTNLRGATVGPGEAEYDESRAVQNGLIDRHPALIVRCKGVADVVRAVNFAREHSLLLSIRGGGHNVAGNAVNDGGIVIDLSLMNAVRVDPATRTVWAQGGSTWGDVDAETQLFGLAVPGGVVSSTGIGGLTLLGGIGHLRRMHGLSIDNLESVDIVTADGQFCSASETENADLFWAVRGAGTNFGVVTSFRFRAHLVGPVVQLNACFYAIDQAEKALRVFRDFTTSAPNEASSIYLIWSVPDDDHFPEALRGLPAVVVASVYAGPVDNGERELQALREIDTPLLDLSGPIPWTALQSAFDPYFPKGRRYYWKSTYIDQLNDDAIDTLIECGYSRPTLMSDVVLMDLGGAISNVDPQSTAYYRRGAPYFASVEASWEDPTRNDEHIAWSRSSVERLKQFSQGGTYLNFAGFGEEKEVLLRGSYGPNYDRLSEIKQKYDPGNLFKMNLNIPPSRTLSGDN